MNVLVDPRREPVVIRRATWQDAASACRLIRVALHPQRWATDPTASDASNWLTHPTPLGVASRLQEHDVMAWMATRKGLRLGLAVACGDRLDVICVMPEHQRQGLGRRLLAHLAADMRCLAMPCIRADYTPSHAAFFLKQGFKLTRVMSVADGDVNQQFVKVLSRKPSP